METKPEIDEAAVWQRVTAARVEPQPEDITKQPLLAAIQTGKQLENAYGTLFRSGKQQWKSLLRTQQQENRQLRGLYVLHFGGPPPAQGTAPSQRRSYEAQIRHLLQLEQQQQDALSSLAGQFSGLPQQLLILLGQQAAQRWQVLLGELGRIS